MEKLTEAIVRSNKYWRDKNFNRQIGTIYDMPNCTQMVVSCWHWCFGATKLYKMFKSRDAGRLIGAAKQYDDYLYEKSHTTPKIGSIVCWAASAASGGWGHTAFVYDYEHLGGNKYKIWVYASNAKVTAQNYPYFEDRVYEVEYGKVTAGVGAALQGFLYHPFFREKKEEPKTPIFTIGKVYRLKYNCVVRAGAGTQYARKSKSQLTKNAQDNSLPNGCLKQGAEVTCQAVKTVKVGNRNDVWVKIPSGWIVGYYENEIIIE